MHMEFQKPQIDDKDIVQSHLMQMKTYNCEHTFGNLFLWSEFYQLKFAVVEGALLIQSEMHDEGKNKTAYSIIASKDRLLDTFDILRSYCREKEEELRVYNITPQMQSEIEQRYPEEFTFSYNRDSFDYVYQAEDLIELKGKKYHGKRNHINKFKEGNWAYEKITRENIPECLAMNRNWCRDNGCEDSETKQAEYCVVQKAFQYYERLGLQGGLLRLDGEVIAFSLGEAIDDETFVVHIEKAFADIQGAYPMMNQQFAAHAACGYRYINREEDMGIEGLRKAKLSYKPAFLVEKGVLTEKKQ